MSNLDLKDLDTSNEIDLTVRGRNSGQDISRPVWFVHEDDKLLAIRIASLLQILREKMISKN